MDTQDTFAKRVASRLDEGVGQLDPRIVSKLDQARLQALRAHHARSTLRVGSSLLAWMPAWGSRTSAALGAMALVAAALWGQYARIQWAADEAADLDEQILSQPAPMQAYTDPAFLAAFRSGALRPRED